MYDILKERLEQLLMNHRLKDWDKIELGKRLEEDEKLAEEIVKLFAILGVSGSLLDKERWRIWAELCKGEGDGAFSSTLELEADDIYDMIFNGKTIKL